jgi:hypothetical protein
MATNWITNVKDATPAGLGMRGDSRCVSCGKTMPMCWDTVCTACGDTSCYACSIQRGGRWYCKKHSRETVSPGGSRAA